MAKQALIYPCELELVVGTAFEGWLFAFLTAEWALWGHIAMCTTCGVPWAALTSADART